MFAAHGRAPAGLDPALDQRRQFDLHRKGRGIRPLATFAQEPDEALGRDCVDRTGEKVILDAHLEHQAWLTGAQPTIADIANFPYVALAPMGDISLSPYPAVEAWIARFKALPRFIPIDGLDDPGYRRRQIASGAG